MSASPRVSICMPTWNRAHVMPRTLATILAQTYRDLEILICDDGSVDNTRALLERFAREGVCKALFNERNLGLPATMNRLFAEARGEYVGIFHDHDLYQPTLVEESVAVLDAYPSAVLSFTGVVMIDAVTEAPGLTYTGDWGTLVPRDRLLRTLILESACPIASAGVLIRASALAQSGGYDPCRGLSGDVDLWIRLLAYGDAVYLQEPLVSIRGRMPDEQVRNGSWEVILGHATLQLSACNRVYQSGRVARVLGGLRIQSRLAKQIVGESISMWLNGQAEQLRRGHSALSEQGRTLMRLVPSLLSMSPGLGERLGALRLRLRKGRHVET